MMNREGKIFLLVAAICLFGTGMAGCRGNLARDENIGKMTEISIVVDATILNERTLRTALLDAGKCEEIAERMELVTERMLDKKGYRARPLMRTVGLGLDGFGTDQAQALEVLFDTREHSGVVSTSPPFVMLTHEGDVDIAKIAALHRRAVEANLKQNVVAIGKQPILLISARGRSTSGGSMLGNVAKGTLNVVVSIGAREAARVMDFDRDTVDLAVQLVDPVNGDVLWQSLKRVEESPESGNFDDALKSILNEFPRNQNQ